MANTYNIEGVELSLDELKKLQKTCHSEGWPLLCRIFDGIAQTAIDATVGNSTCADPIQFWRAQGIMASLARVSEVPDLVDDDIRIEEDAKAK